MPHVLKLGIAVAHALRLVAAIAPHEADHGSAVRYAIVNDADYVIVGRAMFASYERARACSRIEVKRYPHERLIVRLCYV